MMDHKYNSKFEFPIQKERLILYTLKLFNCIPNRKNMIGHICLSKAAEKQLHFKL